MRRLIELTHSNDERVATVACSSILDRAFGKPRETREDTDGSIDALRQMSDEERGAWALDVAARMRRLLEAP